MSARDFALSVRAGDRLLSVCDRYPVYENEIAFLFGESGIGKSLLAKAVYGLLPPGELEAMVNDQSYETHLHDAWTRAARGNSFFVFQEPSTHLNPLMKLGDQLSEGSLAAPGFGPIESLWAERDPGAVEGLLNLYPKPYRPSGGEKQRVLLAMAFKKMESLKEGPTFFVFDEPTGSLDDKHRNLFLDLLFEQYRRRPLTLLIITHDYSMIGEIYRRHKALLSRIHFLEVSRKTERRVSVDEFLPKDYLDLVDSLKVTPVESEAADPVLRVSSSLQVFGRPLSIFEDEARTRPAELRIGKGEMAYLKAQSGEGKTTVAKCVLGLYKPDQFEAELCGISLTQKTPRNTWIRDIWGRKATMIFQHADEALNLEATVWENFAGLPMNPPLDRSGLWEAIGLFFSAYQDGTLLDRPVGRLSGGEKQRLNILRGMLLGTDLVVLDEPLNGLDFENVRKVLALIEEKQRQGTAFLLISHNEEIFDRVVPQERIYYLKNLGA